VVVFVAGVLLLLLLLLTVDPIRTA